MAQRSGLFDSTEIVQDVNGYPKGNRAETADFFAKYFSNFVSNGVFARPSTNFQVMVKSGMTVTIKAGCCFINGYMAFDNSDEEHTFVKDSSAHNYYFIQRMYLPDGTITKTWITDPDETELPVRTATTYDLVIAKVTISANVSTVTDSMITDYRYDTSKCGIVTGIIEQLDTSTLATQLNAAAQEFITAAENSLTTWQGTFDQWFKAVKDQLSGDAATSLEANKSARAYTVCSTAEATTAKTADLAGYYLAPGQTVYVKFANAVPASSTLNINGSGATAIYKNGQPIVAGDIPAGTIAALVYNGSTYDLLNAAVSSAGVIYAEAVGTSAVIASTATGSPSTIESGDRFSIHFENEVSAGGTLNLNGTGAKPIINNYTTSAIVQGDIPADYIGDIIYDGTNFVLLNPLVVSGTPTGYAFFTSNDIFIVPNFVSAIKISACAAGVGRYAGEYILDQIYNVTPGQMIELTVGSGNTVIGDLATLVAGSLSSAIATTKLGYAAGYNGGNGGRLTSDESTVIKGYGGYGGAFGYGGGGGGPHKSGTTGYAGGGGGGIGGSGSTAGKGVNDVGAAGGTTGGAGGRAASSSSTNYENGGDAKSGKLIYIGASNNLTKGGDGSIYGAGGGGGAAYNAGGNGGGGAAGGYGAGGGTCAGDISITGQPSNGMVLIEWGGTVA